MKVYLSPSTQEKNKGVGKYGTEEERMNQLANHITPLLRANGVTVFRNDPSFTPNQSAEDSNKKLGDSKDAVHVALHTNAGGGEGTEVYYFHGSKEGKELANILYKHIAPITSSKDRGVKANRTFAELKGTDHPAVLIEYIFHDNEKDVEEWLAKGEVVRHAIATSKAIMEFFGKDYIDGPTPISPAKPTPVSPEPTPTTKSVTVLADEVIAGKHGTGDNRKKSLGDMYVQVQNEVNRRLGGKSKTKTVSQLADEVIKGQHGTGRDRMRSLGPMYADVQKEVNRRFMSKRK